jgi:hypothetical protein
VETYHVRVNGAGHLGPSKSLNTRIVSQYHQRVTCLPTLSNKNEKPPSRETIELRAYQIYLQRGCE